MVPLKWGGVLTAPLRLSDMHLADALAVIFVISLNV